MPDVKKELLEQNDPVWQQKNRPQHTNPVVSRSIG